MPELKKSEVPALARKLITHARKLDETNRREMKADLAMYIGGEKQWDEAELRKRKTQNRPCISINKVALPCNHIENEVRSNPIGPVIHPVGFGADDDTADIIAGLIREVEYRSKAYVSYEAAAGQVAACGLAAFQLTTDYEDPEKNDNVQLWIEGIEDPSTVYWDPSSRKFDRSDAMWAARIRSLGKEQYEAKYGKNREVVKRTRMFDLAQQIIEGDRTIIAEWTGSGKGPYWVVEFYWVQVDRSKYRMYSNNLAYGDDDEIPAGVHVKPAYEGNGFWWCDKKTVKMYVCDAFEVLEGPVDWLGKRVPLFPVTGQEIWNDGECTRKSLIRDTRGSQKGLNYAASEMLFLAGTLTKTPWTGPRGVFGNGDKWDSANQEPWAFIEWDPQFFPDTNGQMHMGPGPERVERIAEVDSSLKMCAFFSDQIQTTTGMLDPSRQLASADNPAKKVEQLQQQGQLGTLQYQGNVRRSIGSMYEEMLVIFPQILDAPRATAIIKPNTKSEIVQINQEFGEPHPMTGKRKIYDISQSLGKYSVIADTGPEYQTRRDAAAAQLNEFFKVAPQALQQPAMMAQFLRLIGEGNPIVREMADLLDPPQDGTITPEMMRGQLNQANQKMQAMQQVIQTLGTKLQAGLPKIEADKWKAALDALTKIEVAKINASKDMDTAQADREAETLAQLLQMSHETATQATDQQHEQALAQQDQMATQQMNQKGETDDGTGV